MPEYSEIEVYNPSYPAYSRAGNIDMLSPEGFLKKLDKKGLLLHYCTQLTMKCPHQRGRLSMTICQLGTKQVSVVHILTGVCIKRVEFRE